MLYCAYHHLSCSLWTHPLNVQEILDCQRSLIVYFIFTRYSTDDFTFGALLTALVMNTDDNYSTISIIWRVKLVSIGH